jgi:integrase
MRESKSDVQAHQDALREVPVPTGLVRSKMRATAAYVIPDARTTLLPFQFASLDHLDDAVNDAFLTKADLDGESPRTTAWRRDAYSSLRRFLIAHGAIVTFLAGNHHAQGAVLQEWIGWLRRSGRSHSTVNGYCRAMSGTFLCISIRTRMASPMLGFVIPKAGEPRAPRLHARRAQELIDTTRNMPWRSELERTRNVAIVGLLVFAGLRRQELLVLENGDVTTETGRVMVRKGKGQHGGSSREVVVPLFFRPAIRDYVDARRRAKSVASAFLVSSRRDAAIGPSALRYLLTRVGERLGMHLSPHMLRRTCEDWMRLKKVAPLIAMRQLGYRSVAMLLRYSQTTPEEQADALNEIEDA